MTVHDHVQQVLSAWLDGEGDPDQRFLAERHLEQCDPCRDLADAFARVDELVRDALVPAGAAPFEARLAARLAAEPAEPGARAPGEAAARTPAPVRAPASPRTPARAPAASTRPRPPVPPARRPAPPRRRRLLLAASAAALVALVALVVGIVVPASGPGPLPTQVALAEILARAERAATEVRTLEGSVTRSGPLATAEERAGSYRFVYASPDRLRLEGGPGVPRALLVVDGLAARRVVEWRGAGGPIVQRGVSLAPPQDQDPLALLSDGLALWSRQRLQDPRRPAATERRGGRDVYVLLLERERSAVAGARLPVTHLEVWLDPGTYLPVRVRYQDRSEPGRIVQREDVRYRYDQVNGPVAATAFAVPRGATAERDQGFRTMPLERARARASYPVPLPARLPDPGWAPLRAGFAPVGRPTGPEAANPGGTDLVVAEFGRGLERLVMTTVRVRPAELAAAGGAFDDPFGGEGVRRAGQAHRLRAGAFRGAVARVGVPSDGAPYLWLRRGEVVLTLSGTVTVPELIAAAESLRA